MKNASQKLWQIASGYLNIKPSFSGASVSGQRKSKGGKVSPTNFSSSNTGSRLGGNIVLPNGGLTIRDPATGAQYVQIQLLQVRAEEDKHAHLCDLS